MLKLLGPILGTHQKEIAECSFSVLYSDIGKKYYARLGWKVFPSSHVSLPVIEPAPTNGSNQVNGTNGNHTTAIPLTEKDFPKLLEQDLTLLTSKVKKTALSTQRPALAIVPDLETMEWHHLRQQFMTSKLFPGRPAPTINGAISAGPVGSRIWIIFSRVFYGPLTDDKAGNKFYVLRLVVEDERITEENAQKLDAVLRIAQKEAGEWSLKSVAIWNVSEVVKSLLAKTNLEYEYVDREEDSIPSLMWYGEGNGEPEDLEWVANEKFAWC
jgi:hypothetical protein